MLNLPAYTPLLIGREKEVAEIHQLLDDPQCRLLTLVGPGGIGKTRLAMDVATQRSGFADGVCFVALQPVTSSDLLVPAIATAAGVALAGKEPLPTQLLRSLSQKQLLLLLDNFEHLMACADLLVELLRDAPGVKLLVTSRERIGVREEWLYPVHGLAVPKHGVDGDPATYSALHLFTARARQVRHDFRWENEREAVASICRQVEGNPLAVELAASWLAVLPCATIATKIRQGIDILASPLRNFPERHRSMYMVFDHSWQLLSQSERDIFGRLTVFRGGFTLAAAQAITGASLTDLSALVFKSLIRHEPDERFQMHELLRQYGGEKLAASSGEVMAANSAYADYFLTFMRERRPMFDGPDQLRVVQEIDQEYENVYSALRWSVGHLQTVAQAEAIRRALSALTSYYQIRGRYLEGAEILADIIRQFEVDERTELCGGILAECLTCFGWLAIRLGRFPEAEQGLTRALQFFDELNVPPPQYRSGHPQMALLFLSLVLGKFDRASILGHELCLQAKQANQPAALATATYGLASASFAQGDYEQARRYGQQALTLTESLGIQFLRTHIHDVLGQIACIQEELQAAKRHFHAAYTICETFQAHGGMAIHLKNLGDVAVRQQLWSEARVLYEQSIARFQAVGDLGGAASAKRALAITLYRVGDLNGARRYLREALLIVVDTQSVRSILSILAGAGRCLLEYEEAGHRQRLGQRILFFVAQHPSCDRATHQEAIACLESRNAKMTGELNDTLEALVSSLQAELLIAAETLSSLPSTQARTAVPIEPLSSREVEVLRLLATGCSNAEIASALVVAVGTVKAHTSAIYRKLDVTNRAQAVARVHELGILD